MGNAPKPTSSTCHMDIKYFCLCEWVECNLMILGRIDTLQPTLFYCYADILLGHIPSTYSPVYKSIVGDFLNHTPNIDLFVPESFTTPLTAAAARVHTLIKADYQHNLWLIIIRHG
jgi:hypothetical protein